MTTRIVTAPTVEPITLAEAKLHCVIDSDITEDDAWITATIIALRGYAENITRRSYVPRELELLTHCFPENSIIQLSFPPLISVTTVKYIDFDGVLQTVDAADYQVDIYHEPGLVKPAYLEYWPIITRNDFNAMQVRYQAGYVPVGSPADDLRSGVPAQLKLWMKARLATLYKHREETVTGTIVSDIKRDYVDGLLDSLIVDVF